jgi:hypothetical protein
VKYHYLVRELYNRTFYKSYVSVNDLRRHNLHKVFTHPNQSGAFFQDMASEGYLESIGKIKADHWEARGRPVTCWRWTRLAHARFEGGRR